MILLFGKCVGHDLSHEHCDFSPDVLLPVFLGECVPGSGSRVCPQLFLLFPWSHKPSFSGPKSSKFRASEIEFFIHTFKPSFPLWHTHFFSWTSRLKSGIVLNSFGPLSLPPLDHCQVGGCSSIISPTLVKFPCMLGASFPQAYRATFLLCLPWGTMRLSLLNLAN